MTKYLGIDYGDSNIGIAISSGKVAFPMHTLKFEGEIFKAINKIVQGEEVDKIIIGISEGESARKTKVFASKLSKFVSIPIAFFDESLSTTEASQKASEAGIKRPKRKKFEHAYAAALILQGFLDSQTN